MKKVYEEKDLKNIYFLEGELKNIKRNIKLIDFYIDNPSMICELKYINTYDELLNFDEELHNRLRFIRKSIREFKKERKNYEY